MNGSPAIWSANRVQRAQDTQRSRSSSTWLEMLIGLGKVRLTPSYRDSPAPVLIAWFCSGHSPPLSQTGQSSGWLMSSSSITPRWAFSATAEVSWVLITMPSVTVTVQEATGLRWPSTSTMHCRQAPAGASSGWSQKRGTWTPIRSAERMISSPLGTWSSTPSMVMVTRSTAGEFCGVGTATPLPLPAEFVVVTVMRWSSRMTAGCRPTRWTGTGRKDTRRVRSAPGTRPGST